MMPPRKRAAEGKRAASEESPREGQFLQPVKPSTAKSSPLRRDSRPRHAAPEPKDATPAKPRAPRKTAAKKAAPKSAAPAPKSSPPAPRSSSNAEGRGHRAAEATAAARDYANRQAYRATNGKPSVAGRAGAGAAAGAATGAALGSIVPGVGNAVGAAGGAVVGGAGGAIGGAKAKKAYKLATRTNGNARKIIVAEFAVCIVIAALSPLTDAKKDEPPGAFMKRMAAIMGVFFLLGIISAGGRGPAKAAAGFGGIVVAALVVSERNLFTKLATIFGATDDKPAVGTGPVEDPDPDSGRVAQTGDGTTGRTGRFVR